MKKMLSILLCGASALLSAGVVNAAGTPSRILFVSADASANGADGSFARPYPDLRSALAALRASRLSAAEDGSIIFMREGKYKVEETISLTSADSGLTIAAWGDEPVDITGGAFLDNSRFKPLSTVSGSCYSSASRLPESVKDKIYVYNLGEEGISAGKIEKNGFGWPLRPFSPELYVDGKAAVIARYPNGGSRLTSSQLQCVSAGQSGTASTLPMEQRLALPGPVFQGSGLPSSATRWGAPKGKDDNSLYETDGWLSGCFAEVWSDDNLRIKSVERDGEGALVITCLDPSWYGVKSGDLRLSAVNMLCELDAPGEYYIDRHDGNDILYYYPENGSPEGELMISSGSADLLSAKSCSGLRLYGLRFSGSSGSGVVLNDCRDLEVDHCEFYGLGKLAVSVTDNTHINASNVITDCLIHDLPAGGISLTGGNKKNLAVSNDSVIHCEIHDFSRRKFYTPAVTLNGVSQKMLYNYVHDAPHQGVRIFGNDNLVAHNRLSNLCTETGDMGAIYLGRDLGMLGNEVSYNIIENIVSGIKDLYAIYFDDSVPGGIMRGNLIRNVGRAGILPNKGYGYYITDNIFVDCPDAGILFSTYGTPAWKRPVPNEATLKTTFYDKLATKEQAVEAGICKATDATGHWNTSANINRWYEHYDSLYNSLPDASQDLRYRFELEKKYFPEAGNSTTAFSDPNSVLCGANMTIVRNVCIDSPKLKVYRSLYGGDNSAYTDPALFDTRRFDAAGVSAISLDTASGRIAAGSALERSSDFGKEWVEAWNRKMDASESGVRPVADKSRLWKALAGVLDSRNADSGIAGEAAAIAADGRVSQSRVDAIVEKLAAEGKK